MPEVSNLSSLVVKDETSGNITAVKEEFAGKVVVCSNWLKILHIEGSSIYAKDGFGNHIILTGLSNEELALIGKEKFMRNANIIPTIKNGILYGALTLASANDYITYNVSDEYNTGAGEDFTSAPQDLTNESDWSKHATGKHVKAEVAFDALDAATLADYDTSGRNLDFSADESKVTLQNGRCRIVLNDFSRPAIHRFLFITKHPNLAQTGEKDKTLTLKGILLSVEKTTAQAAGAKATEPDMEFLAIEKAAYSDGGTITGIEDIVDTTNVPAEYFNLQGVKVSNPSRGEIYILRQGTKASKVRF